MRKRSVTVRSLTAAIALAASLAPADVRAQEVRGIADLHNHQMNQLGFGGRLIHGEALGPMEVALPSCGSKHGALGTVSPWLEGFHPHATSGYPDFTAWPRWDLKTHQQVHEDWLKRAHDGGLSLIVMLAGHNEHLCKLNALTGNLLTGIDPVLEKALQALIPGWDVGLVDHQGCGGMSSVYKEIEAAKAMDAQRDWYQIVYTPQEAREAIERGKLAVVLGVEIPYLFGCGTGSAPAFMREISNLSIDAFVTEVEQRGLNFFDLDLTSIASQAKAAIDDLTGELDSQCTEADVADGLQELHTAGVRHLFPIHNANNGFGGAALYNHVFTLPSPEFDVPGLRDCSAEGYEFNDGKCNEGGLTPLGESFSRQLMERGMMIDIDHHSQLSKLDLLDIAESYDYPLVSSHTGILELSSGDRKHEGNIGPSEVERIRKLGGTIAPIVIQGTTEDTSSWKGRVPHTCSDSSESFTQAYLYLKDKMGGASVPIGSDFNGLAGLPGPRFKDGLAVRLKAHNGQYVSALLGGGATVDALSDAVSNWGGFEVVDYNGGALTSGDTVSFRTASRSHYLTADSTAAGVLIANRTKVDAWEKFVIEKSGGGVISSNDTVSIKADNGKYVAAEGGGGGLLFANRDAVDEWERFVITVGVEGVFDGCHDLSSDAARVKYPFTSSITGATFDKQVIGNRTFDINVDGLSNVGMLPDFIEEMKVLGLTDQDLEPLYSSAEGYIQSWEKAEVAKGRVTGAVQRVPIGGSEQMQVSANWRDAASYCVQQNQRLADLSEVCPSGGGGEPRYGKPEGDVWMAVGDRENAWVSIGTSYPERLCRLHDDLGAPPSWGTDKGPEPLTGQPTALKCVDSVKRVSVNDTGGSFNWSEARAYCEEAGLRLSDWNDVCPEGGGDFPRFSQPEGDVWMAIADHENAWISVGTSYPERRCRPHEELGSPPSWGTDKGPEPLTGQPVALLCQPR